MRNIFIDYDYVIIFPVSPAFFLSLLVMNIFVLLPRYIFVTIV